MGRLITAEAILDKLKDRLIAAIRWEKESVIHHNDELINRARAEQVAFTEVALIVKNLPTVDAVEVVRCKDCKHGPDFRYLDDGDRYVEGPRYQETLKNGLTITLEDEACPCVNGWDSYFSYVPKDDWFCANGERRAEE